MKLVLANNQGPKFREFYASLSQRGDEAIDYAGYTSLLFIFDSAAGQPVRVVNVANGKALDTYDGVYLNGYLNTYELAATTAICCDTLGIPYLNRELHDAPSLSKLTMHAKLAAHQVAVPYSLCGSKQALLQAESHLAANMFPAVLKRADADRGIDNFKVNSFSEVVSRLEDKEARSLWVLQAFAEHEGFYTICLYNGQPQYAIYRQLQVRPDGKAHKAHMYKPKGGANASLIEPADIPPVLLEQAQRSAVAMNRQICSVDCLTDSAGQAYVLEVNYNPQMVTIETFRDIREQTFVDFMAQDWRKF